MEELVRKQFRHLVNEDIQELVNLFLGRVEGRIENAPLPFDLIRPRRSAQLGISRQQRGRVPGSRTPGLREYRDHERTRQRRKPGPWCNTGRRTRVPGFSETPGIPPGTPGRRKGASARRSASRRSFRRGYVDHLNRQEVPRDIEAEAAPREPRRVTNGSGGDSPALGILVHGLEECLQSAEDSERVHGGNPGLPRGDGEIVRFVLAQAAGQAWRPPGSPSPGWVSLHPASARDDPERNTKP
jgi:hypothetical protein